MQTPSFRQRAIATDLPMRLCLLTALIAGQVHLWLTLEYSLASFLNPSWFIVLAIISTFATAVLSVMGGMIVGWLVFGEFYSSQKERNGGPFEPGDSVQILAGPYAGQRATIIRALYIRGIEVRLETGDNRGARETYGSCQLLREFIADPYA